jgi:NodT family efflux transporter outer membrane factor (OMF) lipoprotein
MKRAAELIALQLLIGLIGLIAGCAVGPDYHAPPPVRGSQQPLVSLQPEIETPTQPPVQWWQLYHDAQLDALLVDAFNANQDLKAAEANLSASRAVLQAARQGHYPQTGAEAGAVRGRDAVTDEILEIDGAEPQTIWLFDAVLDVSYEVDLFGHVRRTIQASRADAQSVAAARDSVRITVAAETARAYAQVCAFGEELAVARRSLDIVSNESRITSDRHEAGANSEFDVVRAQGLVAQVRAGIPALTGQRRAALFSLTALLGRPPSQAPLEVESCDRPPQLADLLPVGDGTALLRRRPDVRQAERRLAAATARIGVATADLYPRIALRAFVGGASSQINELGTNEGLTWGVGPSVSWNFPNQAATRARIRQAKAGAAAALANFDSVVLQALKETEQSLTLYGAEIERRESLAEAQTDAERAFDMAHDQFLAGSVSDLDLLTTEQVLVSANAAVASSDAALVQYQIAVFKALGGGWQVAKVARQEHR